VVNEELEVLKAMGRLLDAAGIRYMLTGSVALNYYAMPRMTRDIDVVVDLGREDAERLVQLLVGEYYVDPDAVRQAVATRGMFNVIHAAFVVKVDFVVRKDTDYRREEFARRRRIEVEGQPLWIVAPEDLVISKLDWGRDTGSAVQRADVRNLLSSVPDLDQDYLERWTERLGLDALYREIRE
jgi:hypothetical protein